MVTIRQLRYFEALAECLHFGRAAERCHVTQPALSMQIRELEDQLGLPLVERHHQGAVLTRPGREIAARAGLILGAVADLVDHARHLGGVLTGDLRLGVIPTIAPYVLPCLLPELHGRYPELNIRIRESQTRNLVKAVSETNLDVGLLALPADVADLSHIRLFEDRFVVAMGSTHELSELDLVPHDLLMQENLLLLEEGHCLRDQSLSFYGDAGGSRRNQEFGATSLTTILQMVASGYGVTLLPELALPAEIARLKDVVVRPIADPGPSRDIGLVWRKSSARADDYLALGEMVRQSCGPGDNVRGS